MKKIFISIFILILCSVKSYAETAKEILIEGNKRISNETIKTYGNLETNKNYSEKDLDLVLKDLYSTDFFEEVNIELSNNILKVSVKEFPLINQLIIIGEKRNKFKEEIKKLIKSKSKRPFIKSNIANDIDLIKQLYSSVGYNFSNVTSKINKIDDFNLDLVFEIEKGNLTTISSIQFIGDKKIKDSRLRSIIASEEDKFWKVISKNTKFSKNLVNLDIRLLKNYYKSIGFRDVQILSNTANIDAEGNINLIYSIDAGTRYMFNKMDTNLDKTFNKKDFFNLKQVYEKYIGEYYSPFTIKKILDEIDEIIDKKNLQFVEHNVNEKTVGDKINLTFNISEGEKFLVERINILGNNVTNEDVIRGELLVDEGDPYTLLALEKSIAKIKARNIFGDVSYEVDQGSSNDLKTINIEVSEKATGEISAGAGVGTNGGQFAISVQENNWLGQGKRVGLNLELSSESILGTLNYTNPNYDLLGNALSYSVSSERNDKPDLGYENSIQSLYISTSFEQFKDITASLGLSASYDDLQTDNTASESLKKQKGSFVDFSADYGFRLDNRNRAFMPTSGSILSFSQSLPVVADKAAISNTLTASSYKSFGEDVVGSAKFFFTAINGVGEDDVRLSKRKTLSSKRLRGFEKNKIGPKDGTDHIGGNYASAINFDMNLPNLLPDNTNTDISLFLDIGNVWGVDYDSSIDDTNKIRSSTGLSANWISPIGPVSFTFSQNLSKANTDITESFNFNLGTTF